MLNRYFRLTQHNTNVRTELLAGLTTFLTMAYIIFLQPAILSGQFFGSPNGMDAGAVMTATCVAAAIATAIMGLYGRYPIAQAPGMGENFVFALTVIPAATVMIDAEVQAGGLAPGVTSGWQVALGVTFVAGVLFFGLSLLGVREALLKAISPSMRNAIAVGIGLFIAFIGLSGATVIVPDAGHMVKLNPNMASPDVLIFFFGLTVTAVLYARKVWGSMVVGILAATLLAVLFKAALPDTMAESTAYSDSRLAQHFVIAEDIVAGPPSMEPTLLKMDLVRAISLPMIPFVLIFLFMDLFDTLGTLIGVSEQAGFVKNNELPRARQAMLSDAVGTVAGAVCGTSTVTSYIESTAGVEQGGRTGLTALTTALLFLAALFFSPIVQMIGSYPSITAPALVLVGAMMMRNVTKIDWSNHAESIPAFLVFLSIPLTFSIADGMAIGFISYPIIKLLAGQGRDVKWLMYAMAVVLAVYMITIRGWVG